MKQTTAIAFVILLLMVQSIGCKKPDVKPPVQETVCQITQMTYGYSPGTSSYTATFKYNTLGNPISMVVSGVGTGNPHSLFIYDQYNRLKDFISTYSNLTDPFNLPDIFGFEYSIRYVYADNNPLSMPVKDTFAWLVSSTVAWRMADLYHQERFPGLTP